MMPEFLQVSSFRCLEAASVKLASRKKRSAMKNACLVFAILFAVTAFAADGKTVSYKSGD